MLVEGKTKKSLSSKFGKHKMRKTCRYFKQLADLDKRVREQLVKNSVAESFRSGGCTR